jgi:hypothetical protein
MMGWCREARSWYFDSRGYEIPETDTGGSKEASSTAVGGLWDLREMTERPTGPFDEGWSRWVWGISPEGEFFQALDWVDKGAAGAWWLKAYGYWVAGRLVAMSDGSAGQDA